MAATEPHHQEDPRSAKDVGRLAETPSTGPDTPAPSTGPDTPTPTTGPDTPAPTTGPDTPAPSTSPDTPAPSASPDTPAPSTGPAQKMGEATFKAGVGMLSATSVVKDSTPAVSNRVSNVLTVDLSLEEVVDILKQKEKKPETKKSVIMNDADLERVLNNLGADPETERAINRALAPEDGNGRRAPADPWLPDWARTSTAARYGDEDVYPSDMASQDIHDKVDALKAEVEGINEQTRTLQENTNEIIDAIRDVDDRVVGLDEEVRGLRKDLRAELTQVRVLIAGLSRMLKSIAEVMGAPAPHNVSPPGGPGGDQR